MTRGGGAPEALALALSPLLQPLRLLSRAGLGRVAVLREIEPLVQRVVEQARPYAGDRAAGLDRLEETARGFDSAPEARRKTAIAALVRELSGLLEVPEEIAALGRDGHPTPTLPSTSPSSSEISIDRFAEIDLRAGRVLAAERIPKADKLLKLTIDLGEGAPRTIVSGVAQAYRTEELVGRTVAVVANLPKKPLRGVESHGMVLFATGGARGLTVVELGEEVAPGSKVK